MRTRRKEVERHWLTNNKKFRSGRETLVGGQGFQSRHIKSKKKKKLPSWDEDTWFVTKSMDNDNIEYQSSQSTQSRPVKEMTSENLRECVWLNRWRGIDHGLRTTEQGRERPERQVIKDPEEVYRKIREVFLRIWSMFHGVLLFFLTRISLITFFCVLTDSVNSWPEVLPCHSLDDIR